MNHIFTNIRRAMLLCLMTVFATVAMAVPAKPGLTRKLTLTDGTTLTAQLVGDEHGHYWLGTDGKAYQATGDGQTYQVVDIEAVKAKAQARRQKVNAQRTKRLAAARKVGSVGSYTGKKKGIIILVSYSDVAFSTSNSYFQRVVNEENFSDGNFVGSMYDYFKAQSDGQFELTFDVVGPVTVSKAASYYGSNDSDDNDEHPAEMVIEALKLADSQVNFADYDWDGDGYVDQVYVVYAGKGEADGGDDDTIWPHAYDLASAAYYGDGSGTQTLDGVKINTYACGGELDGSTGKLGGIGTMCHEFSHCLGYPDFYDTDYSGGQGMGYWDLMDSGSYDGDGYRPAGYTSYERWAAGWSEPIELTATKQVTGMKALQDGGESYIIYNQGNKNEYYLLENRQQTGWDTELPGAGLLILHVDYDATAWNKNTPNDTPSHQRMTWIPADNEYQYTTYDGSKYYSFSGMKNDPFPYGSKNSFSKSTTPAATLYNANTDGTKYLDSSVENITQNADGTVSFNFVGLSNVATPTFSPKAGRYNEAQTVSIACETSGAVIYYTTDGTTPTTSSTRYTAPLTISETTTVKAMAVADGEESAVATAKYTIGASTSDPTTTTFRLVTSVDELEPGMRYIIACGSKATAAGALNGQILGSQDVTVSDDVITIGSGVAVFVLDGDQTSGWTLMNESTNQYLYATAAKKVTYSDTENTWTLANGTDGVIMTYGDYGTMLYNVQTPRFTTYTSNPNTNMIQANLYIEDSSATPSTPDPLIVADESLTFSTTVGTPLTKSFEVLSEGLTEDITVTLTDANNVFSLGATTIGRTASESGASVNVTFTPTAAGTFSATVTLTSAGAEDVTVALTGTATEPAEPVATTGSGTLDDPYTVADVLLLFENSQVPTEPVYVKGIVSTVKQIYTTQYYNADYYMSDDGTTTNQFYVFRGKNLNNTNFTSESDLQVGDQIINYGTLTTYGTTKEFAAGSYLVSLTRISVSLDRSTATVEVGSTITLTATAENATGVSVVWSSGDTDVATVSGGVVTGVSAGTTTITATITVNGTEYSATCTVTVTDPSSSTDGDRYALVTDASTLAAGDKVLIAYVDDESDTHKVLSTTQNTNNRAAVDVTLNSDGTLTPDNKAQIITLEQDDTNFLFNVGDSYLYAANSKKNQLKTETNADDNAKAAITISNGEATITFQGTNTRNTIRYNTDNGGLFSCYSGTTTGSAPQIYRKVEQTSDVQVGDITNDGAWGLDDVEALVKIILGKPVKASYNTSKAVCDVNGDGKVTLADVTKLVDKIPE